MEIFLILVLITLVIIFHTNHNSKFKKLHDHLMYLQKQLQDTIKQQQTVVVEKTAEKKTETVVPPVTKPIVPDKKQEPEKKIEPEKKETPPVIEEEEKLVEKKEEKVPPPVVEKTEIVEKVEKPVTEKPVTEKPQTQNTRPQITEPELSWWDKFKRDNPDLEKFIGENLLSKIAITILVLGVAFFVKYAIDKGWINVYARVGIGMLCGGVVMGFAHRLHNRFKGFSSVLVAGAIAIFYFTIGIAFHEYHIFSQTTAFIIMTLITGFSVFISVAYNRVELAALSLIGGFGVPFMVSTGEGNYKVLFTYILILDIGMLVLAYMKKWNLINILAYAFTILLYCGWLSSKVMGAEFPPYKGAFFFGIVFYLVFVMMNVVNNVKEKRPFTYVELIILISNTFVFYISGMLILKSWAWQFKGIYTVSMGAFDLLLGLILYKYFKVDKKLVYLLIAMTLSFATLAAPVQLSGNYITLFWGAEVAVLVFLAQRSEMKGFKLAAMLVSGLTVISLLMDYAHIYMEKPGVSYVNGVSNYLEYRLPALSNKGFITGMCTAVFFYVASWLLSRKKDGEDEDRDAFGNILKIASIFFTYLTGFFEIHHQSSHLLFSDKSVVCVSFFYHIVFTSVLGMILLWKYKPASNTISFVLLCLNYFCYLVYFVAPYQELQERNIDTHGDSIGYVVHLFALLALVAHTVVTISTAVRKNNFVMTAKSSLLWIFAIFSVLILSNEVILNALVIKLGDFRTNDYSMASTLYDHYRRQIIKVGLPLTWAAIAFVYLSVGIRKQVKAMRIIALVILFVTILKLFFYDINNVSEVGKIIAFILLGIVLLIMAFMYQKIKALIMDQDKEQNNSLTNTNNNNNNNNETTTS